MKILQFYSAIFFIAFFLAKPVTVKCQPTSTKTESSYPSTVATDWMHLITKQVKNESVNAPASLRIYAYTGLALYESQVHNMPGYQSMFSFFTGKKMMIDKSVFYYPPACANAAIAEILRKLKIIKTLPAIDSMEKAVQASFPGNINSLQLNASNAIGKQVADSIYEWSKTDGTFDKQESKGTTLTGPGFWVIPPGVNAMQSGIYQGLLRTFTKNAATTTDPGAPPAYSTEPGSVFYKSVKEIYRLRKNITLKDSLLALSWQNKPPENYNTMSHLVKLLTTFIEKEKLTLDKAAVVYAKNGMAMFDAIAASFYAKHKYNLVNPPTYINQIMQDTAWRTVYAYNLFPSYPSNFAACITASANIMQEVFGRSYQFADSANISVCPPRPYQSFGAFIEATGNQLMFSGLEYRFSVEAGTALGKKVADLVKELPFKTNKK